MDKEKLLQFISDSIDAGASIKISYLNGSGAISKEEMYTLADQFAYLTDRAEIQKYVINGCHWLSVGGVFDKITGNFHFEEVEQNDKCPFCLK